MLSTDEIAGRAGAAGDDHGPQTTFMRPDADFESADVELDAIGKEPPVRLSVRRIFFAILWVFDFLMCAAAGVLGDHAYHWAAFGAPATGRDGLLFGIGLGLGYVLYSQRMRRYEIATILSRASLVQSIDPVLRAWGIAMISIITIGFLLDLDESLSRGATLTASLLALIGLLLMRQVVVSITRGLTRSGRPLSLRVAVVGAGRQLQDVLSDLRAPSSGIDLIDVIEQDDLDGFTTPEGKRQIQDLISRIRRNGIEQIVFACSPSKIEQARRLIDTLALSGVPVGIAFDRSFQRLLDYGVEQIGAHPYVQLRPHAQDGVQGLVKRAFDIVFSMLVLVLASPLLILIALAIKLGSRGPAIFRQRRHGAGHQIFTIFKFRTMTTEEDGDTVLQATRRDPRVTRIGAFLRRTSLDELPQFANVLIGNMSVVGPRPHALTHNRQHARVLVEYAQRHNVKPGITGWAQVNGFRGETTTVEDMKARVDHDLWYIRNWSLWLDMKIVVMTVLALIFQRNAY